MLITIWQWSFTHDLFDSCTRKEIGTLDLQADSVQCLFWHVSARFFLHCLLSFYLSQRLRHMAVCVPFDIVPSDDTSCTLRQKQTACGNNLYHCLAWSDHQRPLIPNAAEHWTRIMLVLRILTMRLRLIIYSIY